jgi:predicted  nucleic acid-binding Zn-ribbon protein
VSYRPFFIYGDNATPPETDLPNELCPECGREFSGIAAHCEGCGYGEPQYACDGCGDMLPESELHRVRSTSGETDQCERCLGMAAATSRDAAGIRGEQ